MASPKGKRRETSTPVRTTKIPLNDDSAEKAKRAKERGLLHSVQRRKMMSAASPGSRRQTMGSEGLSPKTPRDIGGMDAFTPGKRVQIMANFEEMMKMATDNKINAANSWDFALIDYFHDMSLLKEGDSVNFQKASCTLDGCVKIYTSRVDSVATETGKLLSGLADSNVPKRRARGVGEEGSDEEEDVDEEGKKKPKKKAQRSSEATLAKDFSQLAVKKLELEFTVDPLFKKATADRDEGGAKGLLLNNLSIDSHGRIVFDSSDTDEEKGETDGDDDGGKAEVEEVTDEPAEIASKLSDLKSKFFPDLSILDRQEVCPSLKNFDLNSSEGLEVPFLRGLEDRDNGKQAESPETNNDGDDVSGVGGVGDDMAIGFDDGYGIGADMTMAFGEGGEAWANETIADVANRLLSPSKRPLLGTGGPDNDEDNFERDGSRFIGFNSGREDILSYFDERVGTSWAGPEHWRIRRIKDSSKPANVVPRVRKVKEPFEINFLDPTADAPDELFAPPKLAHTINLPKKDWVSKSRNLLPDDKHFDSRRLTRLFLKPYASVLRRKAGPDGMPPQNDEPPENIDEDYWAKENMAGEIQASSTPDPKGDYNADFFHDGRLELPIGLGGDDDEAFTDAREAFSPGIDGAVAPAEGAERQSGNPFSTQTLDFGSQLVTQNRRVRPEYVQYARAAKKVDVRKLKENMWTGLKFAPVPGRDPDDSMHSEATAPDPYEEPRKFTQVINDLSAVYPQKVMSDISTSYCFICLLHLANEKGLVVEESGGSLQELIIRKDPDAKEVNAC